MRTFVSRIATTLMVLLGLALFAPSSASAVGLGKTCGTIAGIPCDAGLWCQFPPGKCKIPDMAGKCANVPVRCTRERRPVCGCDGKTYANDCLRLTAQVSLLHKGACKPTKY